MKEQLGDNTNLPLPKPVLVHNSEFVGELEEIVAAVPPVVRKELLDRVHKKIEAEDSTARYVKAYFNKLYGRADRVKICKLQSGADNKEEHAIRAVKIGPYHLSCNNLVKFDDEYKWQVTRYISKEWTRFDDRIYLQAMTEKEEEARSYYEDAFPEIKSDDFLVMLLLDSAFILFVLDASLGNKELCPSDYYPMDYMALFTMVKDSAMQIKVDLLTLDNQIPFFAVEQLYVISHGGAPDKGDYSLQEKCRNLALSGFDDLYPKRNQDKSGYLWYREFHHLLHLFHWSRVAENKYGSGSELRQLKMDLVLHNIPTATELQKSATTFRNKEFGSFLDITFQDSLTKICGEMTIPTVHLHDYSRDLFRNLIAFEMNFIENGCCVTAYCKCMSQILQHEDDVKLLRDKRIVVRTSYKDADVLKFFEDFNKQVKNQSTHYDLLELYSQVAEYHNRPISNCYGRMKLQYFPNRWVRLSFVGGFILFLLTLLQTVYAVLGYYETFNTAK